MKVSENCIRAVKAYLEETFKIEVEKEDVRLLILHICKKRYCLAEQCLMNMFVRSLGRKMPIARIHKLYKLVTIAKKQDVIKKLLLIISYYQEDYDKLADEITNLLSWYFFHILKTSLDFFDNIVIIDSKMSEKQKRKGGRDDEKGLS